MKRYLDAPHQRPARSTLTHTAQDQTMASTTQIIYQPYVAGPRGSLKAGPALACRSPEEGLRRAECAFGHGSILAARIVRMTHDDEAGEFGEPEFLGEVGRVPEAV